MFFFRKAKDATRVDIFEIMFFEIMFPLETIRSRYILYNFYEEKADHGNI